MKHIVYTIILLAAVIVAACTPVELEPAANASLPQAENLNYTASGRTVTLNWTLSDTTGVVGVQITKNGLEPIEVQGCRSSYVLKHVPTNIDILYTVKIRYSNGMVSQGRSVTVHIAYDKPIKAGYLLTAGSVSELPDDDERAAAEWFRLNYVDKGIGCFVSIDELRTIDIDDVSCLWIHIDREGLATGWRNLTGGLNTDDFAAVLKNFVAEGGNLLLSVHATQLLAAIGRIPEEWAPNTINTGQGGYSQEVWTINAYIGQTYDRRYHPFYQGMTLDYYNGYEYTSFPVLSEGMREDHNCMWNIADFRFSQGADKIRGWELETESTVLGTWGQNTSLSYIGFCDFAVTGIYRGRIVAMGMGAYEWNQDNNRYRYQIERLTDNILSTLRVN